MDNPIQDTKSSNYSEQKYVENSQSIQEVASISTMVDSEDDNSESRTSNFSGCVTSSEDIIGDDVTVTSNILNNHTATEAMENQSSFKEHRGWDNVLSLLPTKIQQGFRNINVRISCFDAKTSHLLFGSNAGCGFLYNRETGEFIKLLSESKNDVVTAVRLLVGIECQTALGTENGKITIVIFPLGAANSTRQFQKFSLGRIHQAEVTCMEWSNNGMKLYTGDKKGNVYLIERDYEKDKCNITSIHSEKHEIVDLSYRHMILLISTTERSLLIHTNRTKDSLKPIGSKPIRTGLFGASFNPDSVSTSNLKVFCTRPGYRIWIANAEGQVTNTLLLKDLVSSPHPRMKLECDAEHIYKDSQFRKLIFFQDKCLTYSETSLFLIDYTKPCIVASNQNMSDIIDVAVTTNEIFILRKDRSFLRIAENPDENAIKLKRFQEEKKKEGQSLNLQDVKESLSEMKKNLSPFVGALQSRMSSLNEGAGQLTQKIQTQAKELQKKLPVVSTSLFTKEDKSTDGEIQPVQQPSASISNSEYIENKSDSLDSKAEKVASATESSESDDENETVNTKTITADTECHVLSCYESSLPNLDPNIFKKPVLYDEKTVLAQKKNSEPDFLHSQGHPELLTRNEVSTNAHAASPVSFHFDKLEQIASEEGGEIVYVSKRKKKSRLSISSSGKCPPTLTPEIVSNPCNMLSSSELHSSQTEINNNSELPGLKVGDLTSQHVEVQNQEFKSADDNQHYERNAMLEDTDTSPNRFFETPKVAEDDSQRQSESNSKKSSDNQLILVVNKTKGNQLRPRLVESPKIDIAAIDFSDQDIMALANESKTSQVDSIADKIDVTRFSDSDMLINQRTVMSSMLVANAQLSQTGNLNLEGASNSNSSLIDRKLENISLSDVPGASFFDQAPPEPSTLREPLFSDSDGEEHGEDIPDDQFTSSIDDIYKIDEGSKDFESEIETDSENDSEPHVHPATNVKKQAYTSSTKFTSFHEDSVPVKLLDSWSTTNLQHQVASISASDSFIWFIDSYNQIYIAEETGFGLCNVVWKKLSKKGVQLCISPSGAVAWLVTKSGNVYSAVMPIDFQVLDDPIKLSWQHVDRGASFAALGHDSAWVVSSNGKVKVQFGISRSNPHNESWDVVPWNKEKLTHMTSAKSTMWCRTEKGDLFAAELINIDSKDFNWEPVNPPFTINDGSQSTIVHITSDCRDTLFAVDDKGILWFLTEDRKWWHVNLSEYIDEEKHLLSLATLHSLPSSVSTSVHKVQRWMAGLVRVQHVAVNNQSVWIVHDNQKVNIARGPLTGCRWDVITPLGVAKSSKWIHITTSSVFSADHGSWIGLVWASRPNGEIFCFPSQDASTTHPITLAPPILDKVTIVCMSACKEALWILFSDGSVYIRSGISADCLKGTEWNKLDTTEQLGKVKLVYLSCGTQNVWAVDSNGQVYFRIGVMAVDRHSLPPAWIPIDGCQVAGCKFTQVVCGLSDGSIWALDNVSNIYVRTGVSFTLPVGNGWECVPGSHAEQICISNHTVWGLRKGGNLLRRYGISERNVAGDYWKKIKGKFSKIAVTPYDELWAIDKNQQLRHQFMSIYSPLIVEAQYKMDSVSADTTMDFDSPVRNNPDKDWEFI